MISFMTPRAIYNTFYKTILEFPDGTLIKEKVILELSDYQKILANTEKVFKAVTNDRISRPYALAEIVINEFDDYIQSSIQDAIDGHCCLKCGKYQTDL